MNTYADKTQVSKSQSVGNEVSQKLSIGESTFQRWQRGTAQKTFACEKGRS